MTKFLSIFLRYISPIEAITYQMVYTQSYFKGTHIIVRRLQMFQKIIEGASTDDLEFGDH